MMTVKQVSKLTGVSVRTLQFYDEIGLLKPTQVTDAGYRLYDPKTLETLRQMLLFKELNFTLKEIRAIMENPEFDKLSAYKKQRQCIQMKRNRLNDLLGLLDKIIQGNETVSFKEFDMSEYTAALEDFMVNQEAALLKYGGDPDEFRRLIETLKSDSPQKSELAQMAIRQYGSIEKFSEAAKKNLEKFPKIMEQMSSETDGVKSRIDRTNALMRRLTSDMSRDVSSKGIQKIVGVLVAVVSADSSPIDMGKNYWGLLTDGYVSNPAVIAVTDRKYGVGASAFIGNALKTYWNLR